MIVEVSQIFLSQLPQDLQRPLFRLLLRHSVVEEPEKHILPNCGHEHLIVRILQDKTKLPPDLLEVPGGDFIAVHKDLSLGHSAHALISRARPCKP